MCKPVQIASSNRYFTAVLYFPGHPQPGAAFAVPKTRACPDSSDTAPQPLPTAAGTRGTGTQPLVVGCGARGSAGASPSPSVRYRCRKPEPGFAQLSSSLLIPHDHPCWTVTLTSPPEEKPQISGVALHPPSSFWGRLSPLLCGSWWVLLPHSSLPTTGFPPVVIATSQSFLHFIPAVRAIPTCCHSRGILLHTWEGTRSWGRSEQPLPKKRGGHPPHDTELLTFYFDQLQQLYIPRTHCPSFRHYHRQRGSRVHCGGSESS